MDIKDHHYLKQVVQIVMIMHMLMSNIININCRYREMCIPCPDKRMKYTGSCECPTGYFKSYDRCIENG